MARRTAPNLSAEDLALLEEMRRSDAEDENAPGPSPELQRRMDSEALTSAALRLPGRARDVHREIDRMPRDRFEEEFADVLNANADELEDDDEAE